MAKPYIPVLIVIIIILGGAVFYSTHQSDINKVLFQEKAIIRSLNVEHNAFVVRGEALGKVELWAIPTGTEISAADYIHLGDATKTTSGNTAEEWDMNIPQNPMLITAVFAKGFDTKGKEVGTANLPILGATDLYEALWASTNTTGNSTGEENATSTKNTTGSINLRVGEKGTFDTLTVTFNKIVNDSRCPVDVQCIQRGTFTSSLTLQIGRSKKTIELSDTDDAVVFNNYSIKIADITPAKKSTNATTTQYILMLLVTKNS